MAALWNASDEALEEKADAAAQMGRAEGASELAEVKKTRGVNFEQIVRVCQCVCVCVCVDEESLQSRVVVHVLECCIQEVCGA